MNNFIKKHKPQILVQDNSNSFNFNAWQMFWKPNTIIAYMGFMGYDEPNDFKKELKGKISFFDWIPINDNKSRWSKDENESCPGHKWKDQYGNNKCIICGIWEEEMNKKRINRKVFKE